MNSIEWHYTQFLSQATSFVHTYPRQIATQGASLSGLLLWHPFFAKSVYLRSQIMESKSPGDLSHSDFFKNKRNYYRGLPAALWMEPLFPATDWILGSLLKKIQQVAQRDPNIAERMGAGFVTGVTTIAVANPYEVTLITAQNKKEPVRKALMRIWKSSGPKGFYTGSVPMAVRNGSFGSSLLVAVPTLQKEIAPYIPGSGKAHEVVTMVLASTIPASIYTCTLAVPVDFMAIMRQSDPSGKVYTSAFQTLKAAYNKHGLPAFKAGLGNRLTACIIQMAGLHLFRNYYLGKLL